MLMQTDSHLRLQFGSGSAHLRGKWITAREVQRSAQRIHAAWTLSTCCGSFPHPTSLSFKIYFLFLLCSSQAHSVFFHSVNPVLYAHSKLRYGPRQLGHCNSVQDSLEDLGRVRERKSIHVECSYSSFSLINFGFLLILPVSSGISGNWSRLPQTSVLTGQLWCKPTTKVSMLSSHELNFWLLFLDIINQIWPSEDRIWTFLFDISG